MNADVLSTLEEKVLDAINGSPYLAHGNVRCETQEGRVVLRGEVDTFFQKQMAQEVIRHVRGIELIENELEVMTG